MKVLIINQFSNGKKHFGHKRHIYILDHLNKIKGVTAKLFTSKRSYVDGRILNYRSESNVIATNVFFKNIGRISKLLSYIEFSIRAFFQTKFKRFDIIFASSPNLFSAYIAFLKAKYAKKPFFFEVRDIWPLSLAELGIIKKQGLIYKILRKIELMLLKNCDVIITTLPNFHLYLKELEIDNSCIYIPQLIDYCNIKQQKSKSYVYVGSAKINHRILEAIETFNIFNKKNSFRFSLDLFISGEQSNKLKDICNKKKIKNIFFKEIIQDRNELIDTLSNYKYGITNFDNHDMYKYGISLNKINDYIAGGVIPLFPFYVECDHHIKNVSLVPDRTKESLLISLNKSIELTDEEYQRKVSLCHEASTYLNPTIHTAQLEKSLKNIQKKYA